MTVPQKPIEPIDRMSPAWLSSRPVEMRDTGHQGRPFRVLAGTVFGVMLGFSGGLAAQVAGDAAPSSPKPSLLEEVYELRISLLEDSLFTYKEQLEAANFMVQQSEKRVRTYADSIILVQVQEKQLADSLSRIFILHDRLVSENRQNQARLSALSDSMVQSYWREQLLIERNDSLMVILDAAQQHLTTASHTEEAYSDSIAALRQALAAIREDLAVSEANLSGVYEQMGNALAGADRGAVDAAADERYIRYLTDVKNYQVEVRGLARLFPSGARKDELADYKLSELREYLAWVALQGHTPDALSFLAQTYIGEGEEIRATLTYLKILFLYPDTEAGRSAQTSVEALVERNSDEGRLFYEVVLNPDSMNVGEESFYRYLHYLDHIRALRNETAREWFIMETHHFLSLYPDVFQSDKLLFWVGQSYHGLKAYNRELLTYMKIRTLYPYSSYIPDISFAMAEVTANDLRLHEAGAQRYADFRETFPNHAKAPAALFAEAEVYEKEMKDYRQAAELYHQLGATYPESHLAPIGLFRYAVLLHNRLASPTEALRVYEDILDSYGHDPQAGIPALEGMALISKEKRQFDAAVVYYLDIHQRFPEMDERAVTAILEAADIYQSELNNLDAAIHTLHLVLDNYPDYPGIKSVQRRVQRLQKKRG